ncbi:MAG: hypothetical protein RID91_23165 [Azospirillaceae bacterium]
MPSPRRATPPAMRRAAPALVGLCTLAVAACGTERPERTAGGIMTGASAGFVTGLAVGGVGAIPGAIIGGAVGGTTGAVTEEEDVNLGKPIWK